MQARATRSTPAPRLRLRRVIRGVSWALLTLVLLAVVSGAALWLIARPAFGAAPTGDALLRVQRSPQWGGSRFVNQLPRVDGSRARALREFAFGGSDYRVPASAIPVVARAAADYESPPASGLRVTWLGHSTMLLEIDGRRVLIDPVWGERASPFTFLGPRRFFAPPLPLDQLPDIDAVVISHDHYDHLDMPTVKALAARNLRWFVPLGVGAHLISWGIPATAITELDWWAGAEVAGLTLTATPARHFSGRSGRDDERTLWAGWVIAGNRHRVFYSGDTALHDQFEAIGDKLGPFDLTMIEAGAYNAAWADVHLGPEQAVLAHRLVKGDVMMPVHWGMFNLALHGWTEPMERVRVAADSQHVRIASPRPGDSFEPSGTLPTARWWPTVPWETVAQSPAWSTGVQQLLQK